MQLKYDVSRAVLIEAYRLLSSSLKSAIAGGVVVFVPIAIAIFWNRPVPKAISQFASLMWFPLLAGLLYFAVLTLLFRFLILPIRASKLHRQNPLLFGEVELIEDEEGVEIKSARSVSRYRWSDFLGFRENERIFVLCLSKSVGYPIPKQGLTPETIQQIREQWGQKLKRLR